MSLIRFQPKAIANVAPMREVDNFNHEIDRLFEWAFGRDFANGTRTLSPAMDIEEHKDHYRVHLDLPGLGKDEIEITLKDGLFTVSGEKKMEQKESEGRTVHRERWCGRFSRSIRLPKEVNAESIQATFDNGVLEVSLPFVAEAQPKKIEIRSK